MKPLLRYIPKLQGSPILVVGDLMVDAFVWGRVSRISPEAPVPVVEVTRETYTLGAAGNVAHNIAALGGAVHLVGVIGSDGQGRRLKEILQAQGIHTGGILEDASRPTIVKTRIIAQQQQMVRVDRETKGAYSAALTRELCRRIDEHMPRVRGLIISDYGKGVISPAVLSHAIKRARAAGIPVTVDPKIEHFLRYKRVTCITPNTAEAIAGMRAREITDDAGITALGRRILRALQSDSVLITRGERGMSLFEKNGRITHIPTRAKEVYDVTGAGDTVISTLTLALAAGAPLAIAAEIANFAAGIVVGKLGTSTVSPRELHDAIAGFSPSV